MFLSNYGGHVRLRALIIFFHFLIIPQNLLFVILEGIEAVKKRKHGFCEMLGLRDVDLNEEC